VLLAAYDKALELIAPGMELGQLYDDVRDFIKEKDEALADRFFKVRMPNEGGSLTVTMAVARRRLALPRVLSSASPAL